MFIRSDEDLHILKGTECRERVSALRWSFRRAIVSCTFFFTETGTNSATFSSFSIRFLLSVSSRFFYYLYFLFLLSLFFIIPLSKFALYTTILYFWQDICKRRSTAVSFLYFPCFVFSFFFN